MITENAKANNWSQIITEEYGVTDPGKLAWVSEYAQNHAIFEDGGSGAFVNNGSYGLPGIGQMSPAYATPLNTIGMGNPAAPGPLSPNTVSQDMLGRRGSGDVPMSTLPMALNVALYTVGLELVPVVPSKGPWQMLSYMDFPYAGGKLGRINETAWDGIGPDDANKPKYVKLDTAEALLNMIRDLKLEDGVEVAVKTSNGVINGLYKGFSRMDGRLIVEVKSVKNVDGDKDASIGGVCRGANVESFTADGFEYTVEAYRESANGGAANGINYVEVYGELPERIFIRPDFVQSQADLMDGFANFATGAKEPMTRAQNETGTGNTLGLRLCSQWVQMGSYEVTGTVTRQQLQDLPIYGVDAVTKIGEAMQNELTQHINQRILDKVRTLGERNHENQKRFNGIDLDLDFSDVSGSGNEIESVTIRQRRIISRILAAANLIQVTGRRGRADWVLTSAKVASALQDNSAFTIKPIANTMVQDQTSSLYNFGTLAGLTVYVDPYQNWNDTRVLVGRKGDANSPGVIFMPYILADQVSITAEGTMAPKMLVNSRFAIVEAGWYPELMYYSFNIHDNGYAII